MNKHIIRTLAISLPLAATAFLPSCKDDDDNDIISGPIPEKTYTGVKSLDLEYCDFPMAGKSVTFTPSANNPAAGTLTLESKISLGELIPALSKLPPIQGPGVLPGSPVVTLPVSLIPDDHEYDFSGKGETEYLTFRYEGEINTDSLDLEIEDVKLKNLALAGTAWTPVPVKEEMGVIPVQSPLHIVWKTSSGINAGGAEMSPQKLLQIIANLPLISVYGGTAEMSVAQAICMVVKTIGFADNGNVVINYLSTANGAPHLITAPQSMIQYVVPAPGIVKVFPNPTDIVAQYLVNQPQKPHPGVSFGKKSRADSPLFGLESVINLIKDVLPMLSEGFPMQYNASGNSMTIYFNNDMLIPVMKGLLPVLADPEIQGMIMKELQKHTELKEYMPAIVAAINSLPAMIEGTTQLELGLNLTAYKK